MTQDRKRLNTLFSLLEGYRDGESDESETAKKQAAELAAQGLYSQAELATHKSQWHASNAATLLYIIGEGERKPS